MLEFPFIYVLSFQNITIFHLNEDFTVNNCFDHRPFLSTLQSIKLLTHVCSFNLARRKH